MSLENGYALLKKEKELVLIVSQLDFKEKCLNLIIEEGKLYFVSKSNKKEVCLLSHEEREMVKEVNRNIIVMLLDRHMDKIIYTKDFKIKELLL